MTGFPGITADYNGAIKDADFKLLGATVVLVLFLLILVYRSPVLALVPLIVVGVAYMVTSGIIYLLNQGTGLAVDSSSTSLLLVLMFGAGTDYCLLLVSRYGARLRRTESAPEALRQAIPEAMPPMVASGLTVIAALLTTLAGVFGVFRTFGPVTAIGIAVVLFVRSYLAARDPQPPRAPRLLAERQGGRSGGRRSRARQRQVARDRPPRSPAAGGLPQRLRRPARRVRLGTSALEDRPRPAQAVPDDERLEPGLRDPEVGVPSGHGQSHVDPRRQDGGACPVRGPRFGCSARHDGARRGQGARLPGSARPTGGRRSSA